VRFDKRKAVLGVLIAGVAGALLFPFAFYFFGLWVAPPRPVPVSAHVPPLLADAIWAGVEGGRATQLEPLEPFRMARLGACMALAERLEDPSERAERESECMAILPALPAVTNLVKLHMRDGHMAQDPRYPFAQIATVAWLTRSFTKTELIDTFAARVPFRHGLRGVDAAARGFFDRTAAELSLPQAALLAAMVNDLHLDPWCDLTGAAVRRRRVLERMRANLAIDDSALQRANVAELGLTTPPPDHDGCR
jgi:hypothetical protein